MKARFDIRSLVVGGLVLGMIVLLAGAVGSDPLPEIGRYQIACTQTMCYLVDSMTGQVWSAGDRGFKDPKIKDKAVRVREATKGYVGQWSATDPDHSDVSIHLKADGLLIAKEGSDEVHEGHWRVVGDRITLSVEDEAFTGQMSGDGQLILWENGNEDDRLIFQRAK